MRLVGAVLVVLAVAPVTASIATTAAPAQAAADVGAPSWWSGDCDANHWNPAAAAKGWKGAGAHRLGASFLGVPVCGPRPRADGAPDILWTKSGWGEYEWECVELAMRFMAQIYGVAAYHANGNTVVSNYTSADGGGLVVVNNGTVGKPPLPGDVVSFNSPDGFGHAGVVASTVVDGSGNGYITMLSQNDTDNGWRLLAVTNWRLGSFGSDTPYGWLHKPATQNARPHVGPMGLELKGDVPVAGHWNGTGRAADVGVVRGNLFYFRGRAEPIAYGDGIAAGDIPIIGDWNGDAIDDVGVVRGNVFYLAGGGAHPFGDGILAGDIPIVGDWDGDGIDEIGVNRGNVFYLRHHDGSVTKVAFGNGFAHGDLPITGDWNGDGITDVGVVRGNVFYLRRPDGSATTLAYGNGALNGDVPIIGAWQGDSAQGIGVARYTYNFYKNGGGVLPYGNGFKVTYAPPVG